MKMLLKILPILMIVTVIFMTGAPVLATETANPTTEAGSSGGGTVGDVPINPSKDSATKITGIGNAILGIIRVVGTVVAVGVLMVIGIKYMMGSAEEKAEYKKTMIPYVIGAGLVFAASAIAGIIYGFAHTISGGNS